MNLFEKLIGQKGGNLYFNVTESKCIIIIKRTEATTFASDFHVGPLCYDQMRIEKLK